MFEEIKKFFLDHKDLLKEVEAIGLFGSIARGDFTQRSDIDIFIVVPDEVSEREVWIKWNKILRDLLEDFQRDITVLVYSIKSLKEISSWYVLRLASDGKIIYDRSGEVEKIFNRIIQAAIDEGLIEEEFDNHKYWIKRGLKIGESFELRLSD